MLNTGIAPRFARGDPFKSETGMGAFAKAIEWLSNCLRTIGAVCLVGMTFLTMADVIGRSFRHPIFGSVEIVGFMATLAVAMALPHTHRIGGHVGVELAVRLLSKKRQAVVDICTGILSLTLFSIVTWRMTLYARSMQKSGEVSMNLELPQYFVIYATGFCFLIFTLTILQQVITHINELRDR